MSDITATHLKGGTKQWKKFKFDGMHLNLHGGQRMATLADGAVFVADEQQHIQIWIAPARTSSEVLIKLLGQAAYDHLHALVRHEQPDTTLDALPRQLQQALDAKEAAFLKETKRGKYTTAA